MNGIAISDIKLRGGGRKDLGDIEGLAASIREIGLLHPVVLLPDKTLVVGRRRLEAYKSLGKTEIPANIAPDLEVLGKYLRAEIDENTCRKELTPSEAVALGGEIEKIAVKQAKQRQKEAGGGDTRSAKAKKNQGRTNKPTLKKPQDESKRAEAAAAAAVGLSRATYRKAKVVEKSKNREAIKKMNATGKVDPAYKMVTGVKPSRNGKSSISGTALEKLTACIHKLHGLVDKPALQVSIGEVKIEVKKLVALVTPQKS